MVVFHCKVLPCQNFLSLFKIPIGVANHLEKMKRDFLWSKVGESIRDHLISWHVCCRSHKEGGLGIGHLVQKNVALWGNGFGYFHWNLILFGIV